MPENNIVENFITENKKAEELISQNNFKEAAEILVDIVTKDNKNWRAYNSMGIISWQLQAWEDAYNSFKRSVELNPGYVDAVVNLFDSALKLRKIKDIIELLKKSLDMNPDDEEIRTIVTAIEEQGEDIYTSERAMLIGQYDPDIEEANKLLEDGLLNQAMEKYLWINDNKGPSADVYAGLGIISYYQQRYKDAFSLFYEAIKLNPYIEDFYLNLADSAKECGLAEEAKKIFEAYSQNIESLSDIKDDFYEIINKE